MTHLGAESASGTNFPISAILGRVSDAGGTFRAESTATRAVRARTTLATLEHAAAECVSFSAALRRS
jgi:hypothetical protein